MYGTTVEKPHLRDTLLVAVTGDMAERVAFLGRRDRVSEITDDESLAREMRRRGHGAYVVLPRPSRFAVPISGCR